MPQPWVGSIHELHSRRDLQAAGAAHQQKALHPCLFLAAIDTIEMSGGTIASGALIPIRPGLMERENEGYYRDAALLFKESIGVPLMLVGGLRSFEVCEEMVEKGRADYVSLSRPLICEPNLIERWKSGDTGKSACISCNGCLKAGFKEGSVRCVLVC